MPSPTKQKANKEKPEAFPATPKELLATIKKTAFNDVEAQKLIDVLLTKQQGDPLNTSEEWIEKDKRPLFVLESIHAMIVNFRHFQKLL